MALSYRLSQWNAIVADFGHSGQRLQAYRKALRLSQMRLTAVMHVGQDTVSNWETGKVEPDRGALRLAADLCVNDRTVYRWLVEGGRMPALLPLLSGAAPETAWEGERREVARWLREKADALDPPGEPVRPGAPLDVVTQGAKAAATAKPDESAPPRRRAKGE